MDSAPAQHRRTLSELSEDEGVLRFAVPKKGRLYDKCVKLLEGAGLQYLRPPRLDIAYCTNFPVMLVFLPAKDIAAFVGEGNVDLGITGQDMVAEASVEVEELIQTGFGKCKLALQAPVQDCITNPKSLCGKRICTSFPHLAEEFFKKLDPDNATKIKYVSGSVEAACGLGLADAVVDLVETGTTMRAAGLEIVSEIMQTQAVLIQNKHSKFKQKAQILVKRIKGFLMAQKYKMLYYNIERSKLKEAAKISPGRRAPSITALEDDEWVSVGAMISKSDVSNVMDKLESLGATDIFVIDLYNCRA